MTSTERPRLLRKGTPRSHASRGIASRLIYWLTSGFTPLMMWSVAPTFGKSFTLMRC